MKAPDQKSPAAGKHARRKYSRPSIRSYGTVRALTRNVANKAINSDGGGKKSKTG